ncbi:hypothetical protein CR513_51057, partial [Mucuna pruriens]
MIILTLQASCWSDVVAKRLGWVGIGVVFLQEGHPISYYNEKLKGAQLNYSTYDRKLYSLGKKLCVPMSTIKKLLVKEVHEGGGPIGVEAPSLRTNSLQNREDDGYMEKETPTLEEPITRGRLRRIQEEVKHLLTTLKDQEEGQEGHTVYYVFSCLESN